LYNVFLLVDIQKEKYITRIEMKKPILI
jgi:hypothetical protein